MGLCIIIFGYSNIRKTWFTSPVSGILIIFKVLYLFQNFLPIFKSPIRVIVTFRSYHDKIRQAFLIRARHSDTRIWSHVAISIGIVYISLFDSSWRDTYNLLSYGKLNWRRDDVSWKLSKNEKNCGLRWKHEQGLSRHINQRDWQFTVIVNKTPIFSWWLIIPVYPTFPQL